MALANLIFSGRDWLMPGAAAFVLAALVLFWSYRSGASGHGIRALCLLLKLLGLAALLACLLEPMWSGQRARPGANYFAVVADNSQGMQIQDGNESRSRGRILKDLLIPSVPGWMDRLAETFNVRRYFFDTRLHSTRDFTELAFDGRSSAMASSLRTVADRYRGQPLAGVILLTDGNATDMPEGGMELAGLPPVYPVVMGRDSKIQDVSLQKVSVSQTAFEDAPVTVQAEVTAEGYAGKRVSFTVIGPDGAIVAQEVQTAPADGRAMTFRQQFKPQKQGISFHRIRVAPVDPPAQTGPGSRGEEATLANNSRVVAVDRGGGPYRILYVAGRPNWEFKFMNRALGEDEQIQLVGLIRVARREPKFEFRGRPGESSNPLFRGYGNQSTEEIERYDQPVLVRLNTRDASELIGGFPRTAEELYGYHAVVVDDLEAEFFTRDQMSLLQSFVSERGGGFLMLGGAESFKEGKYQRTPIGDMLPVYLEPASQPADEPGLLRMELTREGWLQPWARLRNNESDESSRLEAMPPFQTLNRVRGVKPGASVISTVSDPAGGSHPLLVVHRFGNGRVGALTLGDVWRWGLRDESLRRDVDKFWRQTVRWFVADVPERIELRTSPAPNDPDQAIRVQVRVRDRQYRPLDNASVHLSVGHVADPPDVPGAAQATVADGMTNSIQLNAEADSAEPGLYETTYVSRETGGYLARVRVSDEQGAPVGEGQIGWTSDPAAEEFRSLKPNRALLEDLARRTGGEIVDAADLDSFVSRLPARKAPVTESWSSPLWHRAVVLLFALACLIAEWGIRRLKGMA